MPNLSKKLMSLVKFKYRNQCKQTCNKVEKSAQIIIKS